MYSTDTTHSRCHNAAAVKDVHTLLSARLLNLCRLSVSNQPVTRLKALHRLARIVDECKPRALATTILCPEAEAGDLVLGCFVEFAEFAAEFVFAHVWTAGVEDITA